MAAKPQVTDYTLDVLGRYVCNDLSEAKASTDPKPQPDGTTRADARPFDVIIVGGGSFAGVFAQHLLSVDTAHEHRILVLEAGPMLLGEHTQNLPMIGLGVPDVTSVQDQGPQPSLPRKEVWGLPWHSPQKFTGLAYCVGGRSLYWGGWAPLPLEDELEGWPHQVVTDLNGAGGFARAQEQLGTDSTNDFIYGPLQNALRTSLFNGLTGIPNALSLALQPDHPAVSALSNPSSIPHLAELLGLDPAGSGMTAADLRGQAKLEAPLAVQARAAAGSFPNNKFSGVPLMVKASRSAWAESQGDDFRKRLMIVPRCHVKQLIQVNGKVTGVDTDQGIVDVVEGAAVVLAAGTVESTRLALLSFEGRPNTSAIGKGLVAHLRSNLTIRVPKSALPESAGWNRLSEAALFLKGVHSDNGKDRFFHLQITAAGLGPQGKDSEAELWQKIPDIDTRENFNGASDTHVVITLRGIGEMDPDNLASRIDLDSDPDEYLVRRAHVQLTANNADDALWKTMDSCSEDVALVFAAGGGYDVLINKTWVPVKAGERASTKLPAGNRHDELGSTHHEAGSLRMGTDTGKYATDSNARLHTADNAYVLGPALFPRSGSPNPMLTGTALARRLAEHLNTEITATPSDRAPFILESDYTMLFDGTDASRWRMTGEGNYPIRGAALQAYPGNDLGLSWCDIPMPPDFSLRLQFMLSTPEDNSGVYVRFPDPTTKGYNNPAWVPVHFGFEIQIDDIATPRGEDMHRTGAIYGVPNPNYQRVKCLPSGNWNSLQIECRAQKYEVTLNDDVSTVVTNVDLTRGAASAPDTPSFVGMQAHPATKPGNGHVAFRNIRFKEL